MSGGNGRRRGYGHRDVHEPEIIAAFREAGATVQQLAAPGVPDLLVGFLGKNHLVEVKTDNAKLTEEQVPWHRDWKGEKPEIVRTVPQAKKYLTIWTREWAKGNESDSWVDLAAGGRR